MFEQRCIVLFNYNQRICDSKLHFFFKFRVICVCIYGPNNIGIAGECLEKAFDTSSVISLVIYGFTLLGMSTPRPSVQSYSYVRMLVYPYVRASVWVIFLKFFFKKDTDLNLEKMSVVNNENYDVETYNLQWIVTEMERFLQLN